VRRLTRTIAVVGLLVGPAIAVLSTSAGASPGWSTTINGTTFVGVCNLAGTGTEVNFDSTEGYGVTVHARCISGVGNIAPDITGQANGGLSDTTVPAVDANGDWNGFVTPGLAGNGGHGFVPNTASDAMQAGGYYDGAIFFGRSGNYSSVCSSGFACPLHIGDENLAPSPGGAGIQLPDGTQGHGQFAIYWQTGDTPTMPTRPQEAINAGVPAWVEPEQCHVELTAPDDNLAARDPAATYSYSMTYTGTPNSLWFIADWDGDKLIGDASLPPEISLTQSDNPLPAPWEFDVHYARAAVYGIRYGCTTADGHGSMQQLGLPGVHPTPGVSNGSDESVSGCFSGLDIGLAPSSWLVAAGKASTCIAAFMFVPINAANEWATLRASFDNSAVGTATSLLTTLVTLPGDFAAAANSGSCHGLPVDFSALAPGAGTINVLDACSGPTATVASFGQTMMQLTLVVGGAWFCARRILWALGINIGAAPEVSAE